MRTIGCVAKVARMSTAVPDLPIIILAAGQSSRMRGTDKLLEIVDDKPLIRRQAELALAATSGPVLVALPVAPHPRYKALKGLDVQLVPVADAAEGMGASMRTVFAALPPDAAAAMMLLGDLPDITLNDIRTIQQAIDLQSNTLIWRGATKDGKPGHPIVFASSLFPLIAALTGDTGGKEVVAAARDRIELVPLPGQRARADLDTPEDWAEWRARNTS